MGSAVAVWVLVLSVVVAALARALMGNHSKVQFVVCDVMAEEIVLCGLDGECWDIDKPRGGCGDRWFRPSFNTPEFYGLVAQRAAEIQAGNREPAFLHIGASDFYGDVCMWNPMMSTLARAGPLATEPRMILVEPQPGVIPLLTNNSKRLKLPDHRVSIVNAAVSSRCPEGGYKMYTFSEKLQQHFTKYVPTYPHTSTDPYHLTLSSRGASIDPNNPWRSEWQRVADLPNLTTAYVEEVHASCMSVPELLLNARIAAGDIAAMVIDAEGMDVEILEALLGESGFAPAFFLFESTPDILSPEFWDRLLSSGYVVGKTVNGQNIAALHARLFRWPWHKLLLHWLSYLTPSTRPD